MGDKEMGINPSYMLLIVEACVRTHLLETSTETTLETSPETTLEPNRAPVTP